MAYIAVSSCIKYNFVDKLIVFELFLQILSETAAFAILGDDTELVVARRRCANQLQQIRMLSFVKSANVRQHIQFPLQ